jgi:hypothetical protein
MLLIEMEQRPDFTPRLVAVTNQLEQFFEKNGYPENMTVDQLLTHFSKYDIILDVNDLYNMIQNPPLDSIISNIQGDLIVFVGQDGNTDSPEIPDEEKDDTVEKMAKRAMKN